MELPEPDLLLLRALVVEEGRAEASPRQPPLFGRTTLTVVS